MAEKRLVGLLMMLVLSVVMGWGCNSCKSGNKHPNQPQPVEAPTLRMYVLGGAAGAIEPCGCVKDMLGGVDHAAAYVRSQAKEVSGQLIVGAGPMLFSDPELSVERRAQARFKAKALAESFKDIKLWAWAPGANDWALGPQELESLSKTSGAKLLAGNLQAETPTLLGTSIEPINGVRVGLAGALVSTPTKTLPAGVTFEQALVALKAAHQQLTQGQAQLKVALIAAPRGEALRLIEQVPGFQVLVVGKPKDEGEHNDDAVSPTIVGDTLVVQAPNHLQGIATVDLFVRGEDFSFEDATGVEQMARRQSLERRIEELRARIEEWQKNKANQRDLQARQNDLARLTKELEAAQQPPKELQGSYYHYQLVDVRESLGVDPKVKGRLTAYYKRVNEHNQQVFKDKKPEPAAEGQAAYLGGDKCAACHLEEVEFWKTTGHAKAYSTLVKDHKQFNLECVSCHVTGYEKPGGSTVTHVDGLTSVQCEVCHGPGSRHVENPADATLIQAAPSRSLCAQACHHPPHVKKDWSVEDAWPKILGPGHGR